MNIKDLLIKQAQKHPTKKAIVFEEKVLDFSQVKDVSFKLARYLLESGASKPERVALFLSNTPEAALSFLGILSSGLTVVPLDFMLTQNEIINFLNHSQVKILIAQPKKDFDLAVIKDRCPELKEIIVCGEKIEGFISWDDIIKNNQALDPCIGIEADDLSAIFYTSGSTGHPKGVMLSYAHLDNPPQAIDHFLKVSSDDVFLCGGVPFSHLGGFDYILLMVSFGTTLALMQRFHPFEFLKNIQRHKVSIFCIVPAMFVAILSLKEYEKFDLSCLRYAVVFGAPSSPALLKRFHSAYPRALLANGWGMTETAAPNTISPPGDENIRSIGRFTPNIEVKIVDNEGNTLSQNQRGELWVKGEVVMLGYFKENNLTKEVITGDGWFKTGDNAYYDDQGLFYITGRKKDMIKVAGEIVFPAEVEEKILTYPKIIEAAVIGVPDSLRGEIPKAFVTVNKDQALNEGEMRDYLKEHLAHFKIPHSFEVVDNLPKNRTGKIDKTKLY